MHEQFKTDGQRRLINGLNESKTKEVRDACAIAGVNPTLYYHHFNKDVAFRRAALRIKLEHAQQQFEEAMKEVV